jgi:heavy metal translocating P-type ATPase
LAPTKGHIKKGETLQEVDVDLIEVGDVVVVRLGETVPVDGQVVAGVSEVDESSITGESILVQKGPGAFVFSGSINKDSNLEIRVIRKASESQYQKILKLINQAQSSRAPMVRLADKYAVWFSVLTFGLAFGAWAIFQESVRFLAVLVVATPCPLILATPIAIISGISKGAARGVIVKNGGALEKLSEVKAVVFDKTGTLTLGEPKVLDIISFSEITKEKILEIAAALDQLSIHVLARALTAHFKKHVRLPLALPKDFFEILGGGVGGVYEDKKYFFGKLDFLKKQNIQIAGTAFEAMFIGNTSGKINVFLASEKEILGAVVFGDVVRPEIREVFKEMLDHGVEKIYMLTGDKKEVAEKVAQDLGIKDFYAELLPEQKVEMIKAIKQKHSPVLMVGDGVNDAPAFAVSDVGIALAAHGSSAASESADIVILQNNLLKVHDAIHTAQSTIKIAKESIYFGLGASICLMILAALGHIPPALGAALQEVVDIIVIINALRVNFIKI